MRARGPYEVKPRQLRALVLLLALLPVIPTTFVVRFLIQDIADQRLEARERARPVYQKFLESTSAALAATATRQLQPIPASVPLSAGVGELAGEDDPWHVLESSLSTAPSEAPLADALLLIAVDGRLSLPSTPVPPRLAPAAALGRRLLDGGVRFTSLPLSKTVRWRFFSELPEPVFALHPHSADEAPADTGSRVLLLRTRQHMQERIAAFYQHVIDPQIALRLLDENGESTFLNFPAADALPPSDQPAGLPTALGDPLAEVSLQPPLPAWRVQLFSVDASLVDGIAREQIAFYWWSVGGMFAVTAVIAGAAGWALTRRIALHELSNDALAVVSHEMKTPLASTRMFIETLLERRYRGGPEQADDYLRLIGEENARLERLVDGFQTLSRLEHRRGGPRLNLQPAHAGEIARAAADRVRARLDTPGCTFTLQGEGEGPRFLADREALITVLVNLLDNAFKYTGDEKRISLSHRGRDGEVIFAVGDNGLGIEPAEQQRIFERFYQADRRLSRSHEGCGLGLSIVRSVVQAHRGAVSVQSAPGGGSVFTVRLPAAGRPE